MARARNIKPGLYKNEDLAECSIWARYIFPGLWTLADRDGRLEDRPKRIKAELLPFDGENVDKLLQELHDRKFLVRYRNGDGAFIQISKFSKHQSPHYSEKTSVIKPPTLPESGDDEGCDTLRNTPEHSESEAGIKRGSQPPDSLIPDSLVLTPDSPNPESLQKPSSGLPPDLATPKAKNGSAAHYADAEDVLAYLNKSTGKGFEFRNRNGDLTASAEKIIARLKQGYTRAELREVVHAKCAQWAHDDKMAEYLRPATLFGKEKFEQYIGELRGGNG